MISYDIYSGTTASSDIYDLYVDLYSSSVSTIASDSYTAIPTWQFSFYTSQTILHTQTRDRDIVSDSSLYDLRIKDMGNTGDTEDIIDAEDTIDTGDTRDTEREDIEDVEEIEGIEGISEDARKRARDILLEYLDDENKQRFLNGDPIEITSKLLKDVKYCIPLSGMIEARKENNKMAHICITVEEDMMPSEDILLTKLLYLINDEENALRTANYHGVKESLLDMLDTCHEQVCGVPG